MGAYGDLHFLRAKNKVSFDVKDWSEITVYDYQQSKIKKLPHL